MSNRFRVKAPFKTAFMVLSVMLALSALVWDAPRAAAETQTGPLPSEQQADEAPSGEAESEIVTEADGTQYLSDEVIVVFKDTASEASVINTLSAADSGLREASGDMVVADVPDGESVESFIDTLEAQPNVEFAQPNFCYTTDATSVNDPLVSGQWHLGKTGVFDAWDITMGSPSVRVAVLDSGIDSTHPEFAGQIYAQADTVDNDGDAFNAADEHGTHVAGIIAAKANNGTGVAGIAPNVKLIPVDVFNGKTANSVDIAEGIDFAVGNGAKIINTSFGGYGADAYLERKINAAVSAGIVCIAAAGNENTTEFMQPSDFESVISVIAADKYDTKASWSNYGPLKDISAPGVEIWSAVPGGGYKAFDGTSMASPVVAGVVALMLSANPDLSVSDVINILYSTADDIGAPGKDMYTGYGRINAEQAVFKAANASVIEAAPNNAAYGSVTGGGIYDIGASASLTAIPGAGCRFVQWTENSVPVYAGANYAFTVSGNRSLVAEFTPYAPIGLSCAKTDVSVYGGSDGSVTISASGGDSGTYEYSVNGGASWQASGAFGGLAAGAYTAAVRDAAYPGNTASCGVTVGQPPSLGSVAISRLPSRLNAGTAVTVLPPAAPKGYAVTGAIFSSSNPAVAPVDANGNVTFLTGGRVTISAKVTSQTTDKKGRIKTKTTIVKKTVTVVQPVAAITLNINDAAIARKSKVKLTASVAPATASVKKLRWTSSSPKIASVSGAGVVTGKAAGTAVITCTATDGSGVSASCTVTVTPIFPSGIRISKTALSLKPGKTASLKATVLPSTTDFKTVSWSSSNPAVVSVDRRGKLKALSSGTAVITAAAASGQTVSCTVTVP